MPRPAIDDNQRLALRLKPADKAVIMRAVALAQTDMTSFILRTGRVRESQGDRPATAGRDCSAAR